MAEGFLTIKEAAALLRVSEATLRRWDRAGILRAARHEGNDYRLYLRSELETFADERRKRRAPALPDSLSPKRARTNLVPAAGAFVGRERQLEELATLVSGGQRSITVTGPPGVGKTRFVQEFARRHGASFIASGGVWFADLAGVVESTALCVAIAEALGLRASDGMRALAADTARVGTTLLVLDNAEGLDRAARDAIGMLAATAEHAHVVVTSRARLDLAGERLLELGPLELPPLGVTAAQASVSEAVRLFEARASAVGADVSADAHDVAALVRALDGIPLAIELAAARSRMLAPGEILSRLSKSLDLLGAASGRAADRHATLRAAIEASWNLLAPWEGAALGQCSVFVGAFSIDAAEAVLDLTTFPGAPSALDVLSALRDKSLIAASTEPGQPTRLSLYAAIRDFGRERLSEQSLVDATERRHAMHFLRAGATSSAAWRHRGDASARRKLMLEQNDLAAIFERACRAGRANEAIAAVLALEPLWATQGRSGELASLLERTLTFSAGIGAVERARVLLGLGSAVGLSGELHRAIALLEEALPLADASRRASLAAEVRMMLAVRYRLAGRYTEALEAALRARELLGSATEDPDGPSPRIEGGNLACLGLLLAEMGRDSEARKHDEEARRIFRSIGDLWSEGLTLGNLAQLEHLAGEREGARWYYEQATLAFAATGDRLYEALYVGRLATLAHEEGDLRRARSDYERALSFLGRARSAHVEGLLRSYLGALEAEEGRADEALAAFDAAGALLSSLGAPAMLAAVDLHRGHLDLHRARRAAAAGEGAAAASHVERARARLRASESAPSEPSSRGSSAPKLESSSHAPPQHSQDVRIAARMLRRSIASVEALLGGAGVSPTAMPRREAASLMVGPEALWFRAASGETVSLWRRGSLRRLLEALVVERLRAPGVALGRDALLSYGWPGERVLVDAASKRVRVAIATLRRLGLGSALLTRDDGYLIDPTLEVIRSAESAPANSEKA